MTYEQAQIEYYRMLAVSENRYRQMLESAAGLEFQNAQARLRELQATLTAIENAQAGQACLPVEVGNADVNDQS